MNNQIIIDPSRYPKGSNGAEIASKVISEWFERDKLCEVVVNTVGIGSAIADMIEDKNIPVKRVDDLTSIVDIKEGDDITDRLGFKPALCSADLGHIDLHESPWQSMETAPKGEGAKYVTGSEYVPAPHILLKFEDGAVSVGHWDWFYAEGGNGYQGGEAWIEPISGQLLDNYCGKPIGWMHILGEQS